MNRDHVDRFCSRVCAHVRFSPDHAAITAELTAHLEDHAAALEARGLSPEEAAAQAVTAMGNPYALGHALDQTHPPTLPRVSRLFLAVGLLALFLVFFWDSIGTAASSPWPGWFPSRRNCPMTRGTPWY